MAAISASAVAVPNPAPVLAAAATPTGVLRWPTDQLLAFDMRAAAAIQQLHLPTDHLGGFQVFAEGFRTSFRLMGEDHGMGKEDAAVAFPLTQVLSHGLKMFEYRFIFVA